MSSADAAALAVLGPFILLFWASMGRLIYNMIRYGSLIGE